MSECYMEYLCSLLRSPNFKHLFCSVVVAVKCLSSHLCLAGIW